MTEGQLAIGNGNKDIQESNISEKEIENSFDNHRTKRRVPMPSIRELNLFKLVIFYE